jgi:hypothetical protein
MYTHIYIYVCVSIYIYIYIFAIAWRKRALYPSFDSKVNGTASVLL